MATFNSDSLYFTGWVFSNTQIILWDDTYSYTSLYNSPCTVPHGYCRAFTILLPTFASSILPTTANGMWPYKTISISALHHDIVNISTSSVTQRCLLNNKTILLCTFKKNKNTTSSCQQGTLQCEAQHTGCLWNLHILIFTPKKKRFWQFYVTDSKLKPSKCRAAVNRHFWSLL